MKVRAVLTAVFFFVIPSQIILLAQSAPVHCELINTNYAGLASNGRAVLCYGEFGIITRSTNEGRDWTQYSIGDSNNVMFIDTLGRDFFGVAGRKVIRSTDDGKTWTHRNLPQGETPLDAVSRDGVLYTLLEETVYLYDRELNHFRTLALPDSFSQHKKIECDGKFLYLTNTNKKYFLRCELESGKFDSITSLAKAKGISSSWSSIAELRILDNQLFAITVASDDNFQVFRFDAVEKTFSKCVALSSTQYCTAFLFESEKLKSLSRSGRRYQTNDDFYFFKFNESGLDTAKTTAIINSGDTLHPRDITLGRTSVPFSDIKRISNSTIIAVGPRKLILLSHDDGKTWDAVSFVNFNTPGRTQGSFLNDSIAVNYADGSIHRTSNGGATWETEYDAHFPHKNGYPSIFAFGSDGYGMKAYSTYDELTIPNVFVSKNKSMHYDPSEHIHPLNRLRNPPTPTSNEFEYWNIGTTRLPHEQGTLAIGYRSPRKGDTISPNPAGCLIHRFDSAFKFQDTFLLDATRATVPVSVEGYGLYTLAHKTSGEFFTDSIGRAGNFQCRFFFYRSSDNGISWFADSTTMPFSLPHYYNIDYKQWIFDSWPFLWKIESRGKNLYIFDTSGKAIRYDCQNNTLDTVPLPTPITYSYSFQSNRLAGFAQERFFYISPSQALYFTDNLNAKQVVWDSLNLSQYLSTWSVLNSNSTQRFSQVATIDTPSDSLIYLTIARKSTDGTFGGYDCNYVRVKFGDSSNVLAVESKTEDDRAHIGYSTPYPMPAGSSVSMEVYWSGGYSLDEIDVTLIDIYGSPIQTTKPTLSQITNGAAILTWDCGTISRGFYGMRIRIGNETRVIPMIVASGSN